MHTKSLIAYFIILIALCAGVVVGARALGQQGMYLAQVYMLTPALAALITRLFFYPPRFRDAYLRLGRLRDYFKFWGISLAITALSYVIFTLLGSIRWDLTGQAFLSRLAEQFAAAGQDINDLPQGMTPQLMLLVYAIGGLTVFNILPGLITGFGEEFGHRGFMFPQLYKIRPWVGFIIGGLIWFAWHLPVALMLPQAQPMPPGEYLLNFIVLAIGSLCTFIYLAWAFVKSRSIWVAALAHIVINNAAQSFSYFVVVQSQLLANLGLTLTMMIVAAILYFRKELEVFPDFFREDPVK
jgi:membrane protease YdiL (CAAX protease family)